jgi:hypothetical protein
MSDKKSCEELQSRIDELENLYHHIHANNHDGTDRCAKCGLDLRDAIHVSYPITPND